MLDYIFIDRLVNLIKRELYMSLEEIQKLQKKITELEEKEGERNENETQESKLKSVFTAIFVIYVIPIIVVIFGLIIVKNPSNWSEALVSGIYAIVVLYLFLDSGLGQKLLKWTWAYYRFYPDEEIDKVSRYVWLFLGIGIIPAIALSSDYLLLFDELLYLVLCIGFLLMMSIGDNLTRLFMEFYLRIPRKKLKNKNKRKRKKPTETIQHMLNLLPSTIIVCLIIAPLLWFSVLI